MPVDQSNVNTSTSSGSEYTPPEAWQEYLETRKSVALGKRVGISIGLTVFLLGFLTVSQYQFPLQWFVPGYVAYILASSPALDTVYLLRKHGVETVHTGLKDWSSDIVVSLTSSPP